MHGVLLLFDLFRTCCLVNELCASFRSEDLASGFLRVSWFLARFLCPRSCALCNRLGEVIFLGHAGIIRLGNRPPCSERLLVSCFDQSWDD
ncbi:hypothetical protein M758_1G205100 [Ceratodon purpureus]|uniref:Secreted protein n=1 Tax=Ceratodon purpureus TaxID=3225 RepID=A0A8T0J8H2_CERPU|nr:hypothetical protein KC19_1G215800 [Ceratodon purpureus]KAG0630817.1 hypothetical protein M758_1G205100 [Ceratodon purpureus]